MRQYKCEVFILTKYRTPQEQPNKRRIKSKYEFNPSHLYPKSKPPLGKIDWNQLERVRSDLESWLKFKDCTTVRQS